MAKSLVIVESPAKAKTINKYLGKDYDVVASVGHVMDLPKNPKTGNKLGVDVDNEFEMELEVIPGKEKIVDDLKKRAAKADAIFLATDPDREGEAIAAHLAHELGYVVEKLQSSKKRAKNAPPLVPIRRVTFNEITKKGVAEGFANPRDVDPHLVDAQQARRVLDRLVGYPVSQLLWDKVQRGLSAGRVQTVALRFIVEREKEIRAFKPQEYWFLQASLDAGAPPNFIAKLIGFNGEKYDKFAISNGDQAGSLVAKLKSSDWSVAAVERKERRSFPGAPFITSKFQQDAVRKLGMSARRAMGLAQRLYEGVNLGEEGLVGLITYMRTDSTNISTDAITEVRGFIGKEYGSEFLPEKPNAYKSKKAAQEAHEAIRPTSALRTPDVVRRYLQDDEFKVYKLIWDRFVSSQMTPAVYDQTGVTIHAEHGKDRGEFRVTGAVLKFSGFLRVYQEAKIEDAKDEEEDEANRKLPEMKEGQKLKLLELLPEQHFTEPPPRYNEASLVKELEEKGIGRPSTYASIISTLVDRGYVLKSERRFIPTEIGTIVAFEMVKHFPDIFDPNYTSALEEDLDLIAEGKAEWTDVLRDFYKHLTKDLAAAKKNMRDIKRNPVPTDEKCPNCGSPLLLRFGKNGTFYACSAYDKKKEGSCTFTKESELSILDPDAFKPTGVKQDGDAGMCPDCERPLVLKRGRFGQFLACSAYPDCRYARPLDQPQKQPDKKLDEVCPECKKHNLVQRHGRFGEFVACSGYPKCKYVKQNLIGVACPKCKDGQIAERKARKGNYFFGCTHYPECDFTSNYRMVNEKCPECGNAWLIEKDLKSGSIITCPNNKRAAAEDEKPKRKSKAAKAAEAEAPVVACSYSRPAPPKPETEKAVEANA